jgi:hypothetical protein
MEGRSLTLGDLMRLTPLLLVAACASSPGAASRLERVPNGEWGGQHARLMVEDAGATIELDCAHGTLDEPLTLDSSGRFDVKGRLVAEGGPVRKDEPESERPVRYSGQSDARQMSLQLTLENGESAGSFSLTKGGAARLFKCR